MTAAGRGTLAIGILIGVIGLAVGYPTLVAMGATLIAAVIIALILVGRPPDLASSRVVVPDRVTSGDSAVTQLTVANRGRRTSGASKGQERFGDDLIPVDIPSLEPGESTTVTSDLSTAARGIFDVGPLTVRRGDPIGLARRGDINSDISRLIVHPRVHDVSPFPAGLRRDMEGLPSGEAAEGGVTFSNLREYVPGDDLRLVHWRSSARVGSLMVRHNIDVHRPRTTVILDTSTGLYDDDSFEDAVRATASVIVSAMTRRFPFTLRTSHGHVIDDRSSRLAVMDLLAALTPHDDETMDLGQAAVAASHDPAGLSCAVITGRAGVDALRSLGPIRNRFDQLTMIRMGSGTSSEVYELAGAVLINANTSADFAQAWNRRMKR
ncbi:MAG: hypothetical protein DHS20C19_28960 [Acidimicrobiales bacterium]|nr:MAG: hypothetical protein DHS20C19_28960 [Acidimicrobiales bacterium]